MINVNYRNDIIDILDILDIYNNISDNSKVKHIEKCGIFDNFYKEILTYFEFELKNIILDFNKEDVELNLDGILLDCVLSFRNDMISLCKKILISELYKMKEANKLIGATKIERYNYFDDLLLGEMKFNIIKENPVLSYLIINKLNTKLIHIRECLERFISDYKEITENFNISIKVLNRMILDEGDTHNNGKSVIILEFDKGIKLVYKPHSMDSDESFTRLIDYINNSNYLKYNLKSVKSINKNNYGWQKFITYKECENEYEVKAHFYRVGVLIAIFNLIRSKDFHYENIIAHGEFPMPIDMETIISNRKTILDHPKSIDSLTRNFSMEIENSIYSTLMLPQNLEMINFQYDMSGLNGGVDLENTIEFSRIVNIGTDEIGYQKIKGHIESKQNRVKYNGELIDLKEYVQDIAIGINEGYDFIIEKKEELIYLIKNNKIFNGKYRQVLRSTSKYVKFLEAAIHPFYTNEFEKRRKVLSHLYGKQELTDEIRSRIDSEVKQLYRNDVPYFLAEFNSENLQSDDGMCLSGYYDKTMCDLIIERISMANNLDKEKQILYLKSSIASLVKIQDSNKYKQSYPSNILYDLKVSKDNKYIDIAKRISDYIESICIWNNKRDKCSLVALNVHGDGSIKNGPLNKNLYEGSGVILFLASLLKVTKEEKYKHIIESLLNGYDELHIDTQNFFKSSGVFTGFGSLLYLNYNLWKITKDKTFYDKYKEYLEMILITDNSDMQLDIIDGVAGLIIVLSNIYSKNNESLIIDVMKKIGEKLYSELKDLSKEYLTGFSHGYAGFSLALFILSYYLNNEEYYNLAKALIEKENKHIDLKKLNWKDLRDENNQVDQVYWCHGASGITLSRVLAREYLRECDAEILDNDIEMGINKILKNGFELNLNNSICHGTFGNLECLLVIAKKTENKELMKKVHLIAAKECNKIIENGIKCANPLKVETVNFMLGISGVGYELLRLYDNSIPSVLALEVF